MATAITKSKGKVIPLRLRHWFWLLVLGQGQENQCSDDRKDRMRNGKNEAVTPPTLAPRLSSGPRFPHCLGSRERFHSCGQDRLLALVGCPSQRKQFPDQMGRHVHIHLRHIGKKLAWPSTKASAKSASLPSLLWTRSRILKTWADLWVGLRNHLRCLQRYENCVSTFDFTNVVAGEVNRCIDVSVSCRSRHTVGPATWVLSSMRLAIAS